MTLWMFVNIVSGNGLLPSHFSGSCFCKISVIFFSLPPPAPNTDTPPTTHPTPPTPIHSLGDTADINETDYEAIFRWHEMSFLWMSSCEFPGDQASKWCGPRLKGSLQSCWWDRRQFHHNDTARNAINSNPFKTLRLRQNGRCFKAEHIFLK